MNLLLISNQHFNNNGVGNPVILRMCNALKTDSRIDKVDFLPFYNSLSSLWNIRCEAKNYDIIHVHFGGLYAVIIWIALIGILNKKYITFHGTDIHAKALKSVNGWRKGMKIRFNQKASFLCIYLYDKCGFVAKELVDYVPSILNSQIQNKAFIQPLGVDYSVFMPLSKDDACKFLNVDCSKKYVLFSDISNTNIKRRDIAFNIVSKLGPDYELLIMSGVKPDEVPYFINACDFLILTSDEEGSPNIIREALSLNKPVFSVPVGDAALQLKGLQNSSIISRNPSEAADTILHIIQKPYLDNTRMTLRDSLDFTRINSHVVEIYLGNENC